MNNCHLLLSACNQAATQPCWPTNDMKRGNLPCRMAQGALKQRLGDDWVPRRESASQQTVEQLVAEVNQGSAIVLVVVFDQVDDWS